MRFELLWDSHLVAIFCYLSCYIFLPSYPFTQLLITHICSLAPYPFSIALSFTTHLVAVTYLFHLQKGKWKWIAFKMHLNPFTCMLGIIPLICIFYKDLFLLLEASVDKLSNSHLDNHTIWNLKKKKKMYMLIAVSYYIARVVINGNLNDLQ